MTFLFVTIHVRRSAQAIPLAAGCLIAALPPEQRAHTHLLDFYLDQSPEEMEQAIQAHSPDAVSFSTYVWNRPAVTDLALRLRRSHPDLFLFAGGPEGSADAECLLREAPFSAILRDEGESYFSRIIHSIQNKKSIFRINGLSYIQQGEVHHNPAPEEPPDLKSLSSPWLTGVLTPEPGGGVLWETARGCPFRCSYCYDARSSAQVRPIPQDRLRQELQLFTRKGVDQVWILDSTFNHPPERGKALLKMMLEEAPGIHYHLEAKVEFLDRETADLLGQLACSVQIGLQSTNPDVLKTIRRTINHDDFISKIRLLEEAGVTYGLDLMMGLPGDTVERFKESLDFALQLRPNQVDIFPLAVLPGTELHSQIDRFGLYPQSHPPYEVPVEPEIRRLATATDIFYTRGRAVAYFMAVCRSTGLQPHEVLMKFLDWAQSCTDSEELLNAETWTPDNILPLQEGFAVHLHSDPGAMQAVLLDQIRFHYHYAEALAGPLLAAPEDRPEAARDAWNRQWQLSPAVRLLELNFDLEVLETVELAPTSYWPSRPAVESTWVLLAHWGDQVVTEELDSEFASLLNGCDGTVTAVTALGRQPDSQAEEWLSFAIEQGLLLPI